MKELTKIIGLLSLVLMVSCGSGSGSKPNMEDVDKCINESKCQDLGDETPPTETPVEPPVVTGDFSVSEIETINWNNLTFTFVAKVNEVTLFSSDAFAHMNITFELLLNEDGEFEMLNNSSVQNSGTFEITDVLIFSVTNKTTPLEVETPVTLI